MLSSKANLREFITASLAIWNVKGAVRENENGVVVCPEVGDQINIRQAAASDHPILWWSEFDVHCAAPDFRSYKSIISLLSAVRRELGAGPGTRLRIAP